ncbi:diguanylate cyclase domain-containing protein [Acidihalobacter prosperus]
MNAQIPANVMDMLVDTVCVVDEDGRYVYVSASCERLFGYTQKELLGRNMIELVHPDDRERTLAAADRIMDGGAQTYFENRYVRKDGRVVHIMWSARWSEAEHLRVAVARDVTELKRAEQLKQALYAISEAAHAEEGLSELYRHIHRIIGELLPADDFSVALYDAVTGTVSFPYYSVEPARQAAPQPLEHDARLARVIRSGQALLTASTGGDEADWLGAPLLASHAVTGALVIRGSAPDVRYTEEDKELLQFVSTQIATAIERKQSQHRLQHMACHDALTDLPNRTLFHDRLDTALTRAKRDGQFLGLLYIDLDDFKQVNDTYGHAVGDRLLVAVAQRLRDCVRASDSVGRIGGDEFTVLLTNLKESPIASRIAGKIGAALAEPFLLGEHVLQVTASIGCAVYPEQGADREQLFRIADNDMYAVKRTSSPT